jgi:hypothetical protein
MQLKKSGVNLNTYSKLEIMKIINTLFFIFFYKASFSQFAHAKEWSKEASLYESKGYLIENIIGKTTEPIKFEVYPLAAASSGELTTLVYKCETKNLTGLLMAFYGDYWNDQGVNYTGYAFKNIPKDTAMKMLIELDSKINENRDYLFKDPDNNNFYYSYDDLTFLVYYTLGVDPKIRVFWGKYNSDWGYTAFSRTLKRLDKKIK